MPGPAKKQLCSPLAVWAGGGKKGGSVEFCIAASLGCYVEPWRVLLDAVREEQELVPGGDIRLSGNAWLRSAWDDSQITRVCREAEVRKVIYQLANLYGVCFLVRVSCSPCCFSVQGPYATEAKVDREGWIREQAAWLKCVSKFFLCVLLLGRHKKMSYRPSSSSGSLDAKASKTIL